MKPSIEINSWPAAALGIVALIATAAVLGILGWRNPEATLTTIGGAVTTLTAIFLPQALARRAPMGKADP